MDRQTSYYLTEDLIHPLTGETEFSKGDIVTPEEMYFCARPKYFKAVVVLHKYPLDKHDRVFIETHILKTPSPVQKYVDYLLQCAKVNAIQGITKEIFYLPKELKEWKEDIIEEFDAQNTTNSQAEIN